MSRRRLLDTTLSTNLCEWTPLNTANKVNHLQQDMWTSRKSCKRETYRKTNNYIVFSIQDYTFVFERFLNQIQSVHIDFFVLMHIFTTDCEMFEFLILSFHSSVPSDNMSQLVLENRYAVILRSGESYDLESSCSVLS